MTYSNAQQGLHTCSMLTDQRSTKLLLRNILCRCSLTMLHVRAAHVHANITPPSSCAAGTADPAVKRAGCRWCYYYHYYHY